MIAIQRYHESRNESHRKVCLIPSSAHGTNPASASMVSMKVVVVKCDKDGNIDMADLVEKIEKHRDNLSSIMITYPSTHGVYEEQVKEVCEMVHAAVGQGHIENGVDGSDYAVSAADLGSASILPISLAYITMMGAQGLTEATKVAILNANYVMERLRPHYPVLYRGKNNRVAHECIIDIRPLKEETGISEEDIAKRLMDYGFHAPTMSFPVSGTLMIEPTESENLDELDRFCDAMIAIREEINKVKAREWPLEDNPLVNAPHTQVDISSESWTHSYSREIACFPSTATKEAKPLSKNNMAAIVLGTA